MAKRKFANSVVLHTPTGFFVANAGETKDIPDELIDRATEAGAFGSDKANEVAAAAGPKVVTDQFEAGAFTVTIANGVGNYAITGPSMGHPETIKGKEATQARLDELNKALEAGGGSGGPPAE